MRNRQSPSAAVGHTVGMGASDTKSRAYCRRCSLFPAGKSFDLFNQKSKVLSGRQASGMPRQKKQPCAETLKASNNRNSGFG